MMGLVVCGGRVAICLTYTNAHMCVRSYRLIAPFEIKTRFSRRFLHKGGSIIEYYMTTRC